MPHGRHLILSSLGEIYNYLDTAISAEGFRFDQQLFARNCESPVSPGVTKAQATAQLQPVFQQAAYAGPGTPTTDESKPALSLIDAKGFPGYAERYGRPLRLLMGLVALVLLIALTNVLMLMIARNATRRREFSMKLALGAGCADLLRQLLTESFLLATAGGFVAWFFAVFATRALGNWARIESSLAPDGTVLRFTLIVLAVAVLLFYSRLNTNVSGLL